MQGRFIKCARTKYDVIKKILKIDNRYTSDYLMTWTKKDLIDHYNNEIDKIYKNKEKVCEKRG